MRTFVVAGLVLVSCSACLARGYVWVSPTDDVAFDGGGDAREIDAPASGAVEGVVTYPSGPGGGVRPPGILHVWLTAVSDDGDASTADSSEDVISDVPDAGQCGAAPAWPPSFQQDIDPAPTPAFYRFDDVPRGNYCLTIVLDVAPYFSPGESPSCADPISSPIPIAVRASVTEAPPVDLGFPVYCP